MLLLTEKSSFTQHSEIKISFTRTIYHYQTINDSLEIYAFLLKLWKDHSIGLYESAFAVYLDNANNIIGYRHLAFGSMEAVLIDQRLVFATALLCGATGFIFAHNHPTGRLKASIADIKLTESLRKAGSIMQIRFLDHLIVTSEGYYSFRDSGDL